ncbi:MAG: ATP-dependent sacrificial sulfur transferase LarE [Candidatus Hodarchaeaceae archaeon]|nr:ATP-dependent sacrificial sulfur transferase LarE [Candidatus Hodarchaeaceae archaeon]
MPLDEKKQRLMSIILECESAVIAFSGGVDSSTVCAAARDVLGDQAVAVTAVSPTYPPGEREIAQAVAKRIGINHLVITTCELHDPNFIANPSERCYYCKRELLQKLDGVRRELEFRCILDGTNRDDYSDFRPGIRALKEFGARSPLAEAGLTKEEVRELAAEYGLPNANKPANPCLASRVPFGQKITPEKLERIARGEEFLRSLGFRVVRVRDQGTRAKIEVGQEEVPRARELEGKIVPALHRLGYPSVVIDPQGYRPGGANFL